MNANAILLDSLGRVEESLRRGLDHLTLDQLHHQPRPDANSIAWLAWHLTRLQDHHVSALAGRDQLWQAGWADRFSMAPEPQNVGFGHTPEQVAALRIPDVATMLAYYAAVAERSRAYIESLAETDLDRVLNEPRFNPMPTVGVRLVSVINDCTVHVGQIQYIHGLISGKGWLGY